MGKLWWSGFSNRGDAGGRRYGDPFRRVRLGIGALLLVSVVGTLGYTLLGLHVLEALYMTIVTISTVGFAEISERPEEVDGAYRAFTAGLILVGVGTALYTLTVTLETLIEFRMSDRLRRRKMDREISTMQGHVVVCGYGRLGRTIAGRVVLAGGQLVVIDRDPEQLADCDHHFVHGEATDDEVLHAAGLDNAATLIAATDDDADNVYVVLSARQMQPSLFIIARAKHEAAEPKLLQAGADRVVNPQLIGGERIAAMTLQPHVADFLDVVMHEEGLEFRLGEVEVSATSPLVGRTLRDSHLRDRTGAMVLAIRERGGEFLTNPPPESRIAGDTTLIAIGTSGQLESLARVARGGAEAEAPGGESLT